VSDERFLNSYHNASTPPGPDVPAELAAFMLAVDPVLIQATGSPGCWRGHIKARRPS
jgi:hypothetical protein